MSLFGPYERVAKLDAAGKVWSARKGASAPIELAIKSVLGAQVDSSLAAHINALRSASELQKKMGDRKTGGWAHVEAIGPTSDGGIYAVSPLYPASLLKWSREKRRLNSAQLTRIADEITAAALSVASLYGRGHGNLKLSNVLLSDADPKHAKVLLCDPAPPGAAIAEDPLTDRQALGRMLFELATGLTYHDPPLPLTDLKLFESLGPDAAKWMDWSNRLLVAKGSNDAYTLEKFHHELKPQAAVRASPTGSKSLAAVVLVVAALAVGGAFYFLHKPNQVSVAPPAATPAQPQSSPSPAPAPISSPPSAPVTPPPEIVPLKPAPPASPPAPTPEPPVVKVTPAPPPAAPVPMPTADFTNPIIARSFDSWRSNKGAAETPGVVGSIINALTKLQSDWVSSPSKFAPVTRTYDAKLKALLSQTIDSIAQSPDQADAAMAIFRESAESLRQTAGIVEAGYQAIDKAQTQLNSTAVPDAQALLKLQDDLKRAAEPLPDWPQAPIGPVLDQISRVIDALQTSDINRLASDASEKTPALSAAVCTRWPAVHGDADTDAAIYQNLTRALGRVPPEVAAATGDLWIRRVGEQPDITQAAHLVDLALTLDLPQKSQLAPIYFNARLTELKRQFARDDQTDHSAAVDAFVAAVTGLSQPRWAMDDTSRAAVDRALAAIHLSQAPRGNGQIPAQFTTFPGSDDLVYLPPFEPTHQLRFKRLQNIETGGTFYLCTTEVTVGWFKALVNDQHAPVIWRRLLNQTVPARLAGPVAWRADILRGEIELNRDKSWLDAGNHEWDQDRDKYIPAGDGPANQSPMQYVSPLAAMEAARLVGCRLPTVAEWQSAYQSSLRDQQDNVSGGNWARLRQSIADLQPPPASAPTLLKFQMELGIVNGNGDKLPFAGSVRDDSDDALWFRAVPTGKELFHDLHGNVSQWVLADSPDAPAPRLEADDPITITDETGRHTVENQDDFALAGFYRHCQRIGLSSTSGKSEDPQAPSIPADPDNKHHHQFFDVGFRLALDDPASPPGAALAATVRGLKPIEP